MNGSFLGAGDILPVPQTLSNAQTTGGSTVYADAGIVTTSSLVNTTNTVKGNEIIKGNNTINGNAFYLNDLTVGGNIKINGVNTSAIPTGATMMYAGPTSPAGWLLCDGAGYPIIGDYSRLFAVIGYTYGGSGSTFNVPDMRGRIPVSLDGSSGRISINNTVGAIGGEEQHTLTVNEYPIHNHNSSGFIVSGSGHIHDIATGSGTTTSAGDHSHLFTGSVTDHNHGITAAFFDPTTNLPPSQSTPGITITSPAIDFGKTTNTVNETSSTFGAFQSFSSMDGSHQHNLVTTSSATTNDGVHSHTFTTGAVGGNLGHNNMQPYLVINYIIKY